MGKTEGPAAGAGLESCRAPWADQDKGSDTGGLVPGSCAAGSAGGRGGDGAEARNARSGVLSGLAAGTLGQVGIRELEVGKPGAGTPGLAAGTPVPGASAPGPGSGPPLRRSR